MAPDDLVRPTQAAERAQGMRRVVIVQRILPHYRVEFFRRLAARLEQEQAISLNVIYGEHLPGDVPETVHPPDRFAQEVRNHYLSWGARSLVWQRIPKQVWAADLVILEHSAALLTNHLILLGRRLLGRPVAFWGHGRNMQENRANRVSESLKRFLARQADWWFAYTDISAQTLSRLGIPSDRISVVNNAIDTNALAAAASALDASTLESLRRELAIRGRNVAVYCGGIYREKRPEVLIAACESARQQLKALELIVIGHGPSQSVIEDAARRYEWVHYVGPRFGLERVRYMALAQCMLLPGPVGLAILDGFALRLPIITTNNGLHGPEIAYFVNEWNGLMTADEVQEYARSLVRFFSDNDLLTGLVRGCEESANTYTLDAMVTRFLEGVVRGLSH